MSFRMKRSRSGRHRKQLVKTDYKKIVEELQYYKFLKEIEKEKFIRERFDADDDIKSLNSFGSTKYFKKESWNNHIEIWKEYCFMHIIIFPNCEEELNHLVAFVLSSGCDCTCCQNISSWESDNIEEFIDYAKIYIGMKDILKDIQYNITNMERREKQIDSAIAMCEMRMK